MGGWGRVITKLFRFAKNIDNSGWPLSRVNFRPVLLLLLHFMLQDVNVPALKLIPKSAEEQYTKLSFVFDVFMTTGAVELEQARSVQ